MLKLRNVHLCGVHSLPLNSLLGHISHALSVATGRIPSLSCAFTILFISQLSGCGPVCVTYLHIFTTSQVLYYEVLPIKPKKDKVHGYHYMTPNDMPHLINPVEARLGMGYTYKYLCSRCIHIHVYICLFGVCSLYL